MTGPKIKYLLALLNSSIAKWYFNIISTSSGMGTNRWLKYKIEQLPIRFPIAQIEMKIEDIVNQILMEKEVKPKVTTKELEDEIDNLIYSVYELSEKEIKIIEESS